METEHYLFGTTESVDNCSVSDKKVSDESGYVGRFSIDGEIVSAGKFFDGTLGVYGRDGQFHYDPRHEKMYYEGEYDDISDEAFEAFKAKIDTMGST